MKRALLAIMVLAVISACSRPPQSAPAASTVPASRPLKAEDRIVYYPAVDRVLARGDGSEDDIRWKPLGISLPADLAQVHHALVLSDTALMDRDGNSKGQIVPAGAVATVQAVGPWQKSGSGFSRLYQVQGTDPGLRGWIDARAAALILAEEPGLQVGIIPRRIVVGGGEADYSLLVVADRDHVTILDTSYFPFPGEFHPSGVVAVSLKDVNADSRAEIIVEAETIVSLRLLGSTPIRWKAWLRRGYLGALVSIFRYNEDFGSDSGYSYSATDRVFDSTRSGFRDTVRVDTTYSLVSGTEEFRNNTVSFYPWNGSEFRHSILEDLPRLGTVTTARADVHSSADARSAVVATLSAGDTLYVSDRSDTRQDASSPDSWWYQVVAKSGREGWVSGTNLALSWLDPMKTNRAAFLAEPSPR